MVFSKNESKPRWQVKTAGLVMVLACTFGLSLAPSFANAPPVRIAVVTGGGSGIEQEVVDRITNQLQNIEGVAISTVNPDWYVVCNIKEVMDQMGGSVRYNGNVIVKTADGHVLNTVAVQKYNQDFSLSPGTPINKALVDKAARDVIANVADRVVQPLQQSILVETEGRERIAAASEMANEGRYDQALQTLEAITPDFAHFDAVRQMHAQLELDRDAKKHIDAGMELQKEGKLTEAIAQYREVNVKSKLLPIAKKKTAECQAALRAKSASHVAAKKPAATTAAKDAPVKQKTAHDILQEVTAAPK